MDFLHAADLVAVFVAATSGALAARQKEMDFFGSFMLAVITGTGGGTLRSLLIGDHPVPVFRAPDYLIVAALAAIACAFLAGWLERMKRIVSTVDAFAIGVFMVIGVRIGQQHQLDWWVCLCLGVITATFGGVLRDVARNEVPLIFRKEIYATACLIGGGVLLALDAAGARPGLSLLIGGGTATTIRLLAIRYAINRSE